MKEYNSISRTELTNSNHQTGFPDGSVVQNLPAKVGDTGSIPGLGRFPEGKSGYQLQYFCLGNPMDRGAWWATVHGVTKESDTSKQLNNNKNDHVVTYQFVLNKCNCIIPLQVKG